MKGNSQEEKFIYFIEFEEGNHFSKAEFDEPLEDVISNRVCLNQEHKQQGFTFIKNKEGYWLNYALIKVFRRV